MKLLPALGMLMATQLFAAGTIYDFELKTIDGAPLPLSSYKGKVVLLVNVASRCGYTPQYAGLEQLWQKYKDRGVVLLGIPANNFGGQEPGTEAEIKTFCSRKYNVSFPMASKLSVTGDTAHPLYQFLTQAAGAPKWNFNKYLIGKDGKVLHHFESKVAPDAPELAAAIDAALSH
jgi:glutathione peroxidase